MMSRWEGGWIQKYTDPVYITGFRRAENIKRTVELELWFYGQMFGFPVEGVEGVEIYNFPKNAA